MRPLFRQNWVVYAKPPFGGPHHVLGYLARYTQQFRRFRTRLGPPVATKAMAAKLARLIYRMLRYGMKYTDQGAALYDAQHRKQQVIHLKRKAAQLGLEIIEVAPAA